MGDCGITPEESWSEYDWKFFGDDAPKREPITYENVCQFKSISKTITIRRGSDGKYYILGRNYNSFIEALNTVDAFVLHPTFIVPTLIHLDVIEQVADELNKVLKTALILEDDENWRKEWEVLLNRKSRFDRRKCQINFVRSTSKPNCVLPNHLGEAHQELTAKLESYLKFLFDGLYPYRLLNLDHEQHPAIFRQHQMFSVLQLKYANLLVAWSDRRGKVDQQFGIDEFGWITNIEIEEHRNYFKKNKHPEPEQTFTIDYSKYGRGTFWERLEPLFAETVIAYEDYLSMKLNGVEENEAMYYSALSNEYHKELAKLLVERYANKDVK